MSFFDFDPAPLDLSELARTLGIRCLELDAAFRGPRERTEPLSEATAAVESAVVDGLDGWGADAPAEELLEQLRLILEAVDIDELPDCVIFRGTLRGLCRTLVDDHFRSLEEPVFLAYGDPFPVAIRSPSVAYPMSPSMPQHELLSPLRGTGFRIWNQPDTGAPRVRLDYTQRHLLDEYLYTDGTLPVCATVHPHAGLDDLDIAAVTLGHDSFFGLGPPSLDIDAVGSELRAAAESGAAAAVLPEMALRSPDELAATIRSDSAALPPLIVAGSAHDAATRMNSSIAYLDGAPVLRHDKIRPFEWDDPHGNRRLEDIECGDTITVLCAQNTAMAVAICSDLLDEQLVARLVAAGTNLLLVPALSPKPSNFPAVAATIASARGLAVVANGSVKPSSAQHQPFMVIYAVPHEHNTPQTVGQPDSGGRRRTGLVLSGTGHFRWLP